VEGPVPESGPELRRFMLQVPGGRTRRSQVQELSAGLQVARRVATAGGGDPSHESPAQVDASDGDRSLAGGDGGPGRQSQAQRVEGRDGRWREIEALAAAIAGGGVMQSPVDSEGGDRSWSLAPGGK
jgi:hypothetical protein